MFSVRRGAVGNEVRASLNWLRPSKPIPKRDPDLNSSMSCSRGQWCTRADTLLGVEGIHISSVTATGAALVLGVETGEDVTGCPDCGMVAVGHGRRPSGSTTSRVSAGLCGCSGPSASGDARTRLPQNDVHGGAPDGGTPGETDDQGSGVGGTDALQHFDTSVSALAHQLGVSWHTLGRHPSARHPGGSQRLAGSKGWTRSASMSMSGPTPARRAPAWSPGSWTTPATPKVPGACPAAGPRARSLREGLRRLAQRPRRGIHRRHQDGSAGSVPRLRQRDPRRTARSHHRPGRVPCRETGISHGR
jgi:hypothetical protein